MSIEHKLSRLVPPAVVLLGALVGVAMGCGTKQEATGPGRLAVALTDAPAPAVKEIVVTINKVTAHSEEQGWVTVATDVGTLNLLELKDRTMELGFADLPAGTVSQVRLHLDPAAESYVTLEDGTRQPLTVPSGLQSGVKVIGPFTIASCETTHLLLDFDGEHSIFAHPTTPDAWILRPVIKVKQTGSEDTGCTPPTEPTEPTVDAGTPTETTTPGGAGAPCATGSQCLSGVCTDGFCEIGWPGAPCNRPADCSSGVCTAQGTCGSAPEAGGAGSTCNAPSECLSGSCTNKVCDPGEQGAACKADTDCNQGLSCIENTCTPSIG